MNQTLINPFTGLYLKVGKSQFMVDSIVTWHKNINEWISSSFGKCSENIYQSILIC